MRKSILFFASEFPPGPGGLGTHAFQLSRHLRMLGWKVCVISPQDYASPAEVSTFNSTLGFQVLTLPSGRGALIEGLYRFQFLLKHARQTNPDVIIVSGERAVWLAVLVCSLTSKRWVAVGHGTEYGLSSGWRAFLTRASLSKADMVVAVSNYTQTLIHSLGASPRREVVIPNAADPDAFTRLAKEQIDDFRERSGMSGCNVILTVGQVTERKGQEIVIRTLPQVLNVIPNAHYVMVGLATGKDSLATLARSLGVDERIHFQGRVSQDELLLYMNCCDVFAMTSRMTRTGDCEGYGIAVVEAALCGKPAVVSGESGLAEAVVDGETGLVVPPNDVNATAAALIRLLSDDALRTSMGEKAYRRAITEQTWSHRARQFDDALRTVLMQNGSVIHDTLEPASSL